MANKDDGSSGKRGPGAFKLCLIVILLLLVPTTMEQLSMHHDTVKLVGRVCVGIALLFFAYGILSKVLRFAGLVLLVLIGARALANEGVVEVPKLMPRIEAAREQRK